MTLAQARINLFYLFVFSIPWQTRWIIRDPLLNGGVWEYGRVSLYGWDILLVLLLAVNWRGVVTQAVALRRQAAEQLISRDGKAFLFSSLFVAYTLITALWAGGVAVAFVWAMRFLLAVLGVWLLVRAVQPRVDYTMAALAAAGTTQALWGVWQLVTQKTFSSKWLGVALHSLNEGGTSVVLTSAGRWLRAYGGQAHPNILGGLLAITLLATAWLIVSDWQRGRALHLWLRLAFLAQMAGLFASFSRGAWLALSVTLAVWWWQAPEARFKSRPVLVAAVGVFTIMAFVWWSPFVGRLSGGSRLEQQSVAERVGGLKDSRQLLDKGWWRGLGVGSYTGSLVEKHPGLMAWQYQPVHNIGLLPLLELGIVGFILLLITLWQRVAAFSIRTHMLLVPVLITGIFDHYSWTMPSMLLLTWLIIALPLSAGRRSD